jgi:hypothetical protein
MFKKRSNRKLCLLRENDSFHPSSPVLPYVLDTQTCHFHHPHTRRPIAAVAPADAISCRALTLLVVTLGKLLAPVRGIEPGPVLMRLLPFVLALPLIFEIRRVGAGGFLTGLAPEASRPLTVVLALKVPGGSGRGLLEAEGVAVTVLCRLIGESFRAT